jgi:hypothetical protein
LELQLQLARIDALGFGDEDAAPQERHLELKSMISFPEPISLNQQGLGTSALVLQSLFQPGNASLELFTLRQIVQWAAHRIAHDEPVF